MSSPTVTYETTYHSKHNSPIMGDNPMPGSERHRHLKKKTIGRHRERMAEQMEDLMNHQKLVHTKRISLYGKSKRSRARSGARSGGRSRRCRHRRTTRRSRR